MSKENEMTETLIYRDATGREVKLVCPWGDHSGNIPPPVIEFSTGSFVYQSAAHDRTEDTP